MWDTRTGKNEALYGGAKRDRTADLLVANEALSQLSYSPTNGNDLLILAGLPVLQTVLDTAEERV